MSELQNKASELTARMLQKHLYVVLTTPLKSASELATLLTEHLNYMISLEKKGVLFASGPFLAGEQVAPGSGMTIIRASSLEEAKQPQRKTPTTRRACVPSRYGNGNSTRAVIRSRSIIPTVAILLINGASCHNMCLPHC